MVLEHRFFSCGTAKVTELVPLCRLCLCLVAWAALLLSLQQDPCFSPIILLHLAGREATSSRSWGAPPDRPVSPWAEIQALQWDLGFGEQTGNGAGGAEGEVPLPGFMYE